MNPYAMLGCGIGTNEAASLCARLTVWHDAMVAHERTLRSGNTREVCDDECPHAEARLLWSEAVATLESRARELTFLRSRAAETSRRPKRESIPAEPIAKATDVHHGTEHSPGAHGTRAVAPARRSIAAAKL